MTHFADKVEKERNDYKLQMIKLRFKEDSFARLRKQNDEIINKYKNESIYLRNAMTSLREENKELRKQVDILFNNNSTTAPSSSDCPSTHDFEQCRYCESRFTALYEEAEKCVDSRLTDVVKCRDNMDFMRKQQSKRMKVRKMRQSVNDKFLGSNFTFRPLKKPCTRSKCAYGECSMIAGITSRYVEMSSCT